LDSFEGSFITSFELCLRPLSLNLSVENNFSSMISLVSEFSS
jgi:hypothetical protein